MNNRELTPLQVLALLERRAWLREADQLCANANRCRTEEGRAARLNKAAELRRKAGCSR